MANNTIIEKENIYLEPLLIELKEIKNYLKKFLAIIPEESLNNYENISEIKENYLKSLKSFSPSKNSVKNND